MVGSHLLRGLIVGCALFKAHDLEENYVDDLQAKTITTKEALIQEHELVKNFTEEHDGLKQYEAKLKKP